MLQHQPNIPQREIHWNKIWKWKLEFFVYFFMRFITKHHCYWKNILSFYSSRITTLFEFYRKACTSCYDREEQHQLCRYIWTQSRFAWHHFKVFSKYWHSNITFKNCYNGTEKVPFDSRNRKQNLMQRKRKCSEIYLHFVVSKRAELKSMKYSKTDQHLTKPADHMFLSLFQFANDNDILSDWQCVGIQYQNKQAVRNVNLVCPYTRLSIIFPFFPSVQQRNRLVLCTAPLCD